MKTSTPPTNAAAHSRRAGRHLAGACAAGLFALFTAAGALAADFPQGLVLHFSFDEIGSGGTINDRSWRGNTGRATGLGWTATSKQGGGVEFASTNSVILVHHTPVLNVTQATFAVWFKTARADAAERWLLEKRPERGFALSIAGDTLNAGSRGKLRAVVNGQAVLSDAALADGAWHHGAATFDGAQVKLYVDGQLQKQLAPLRGTMAANDSKLAIGRNLSSPPPRAKDVSFAGSMDEVMIFNHALTAAELEAVIAAAKPKFTKDQVARRLAELKDLLARGLILQELYDR